MPVTQAHEVKIVSFLSRWLVESGHQLGQGLAEYALILALIAVIAIAALVFLGTQISAILSSVGGSI